MKFKLIWRLSGPPHSYNNLTSVFDFVGYISKYIQFNEIPKGKYPAKVVLTVFMLEL